MRSKHSEIRTAAWAYKAIPLRHTERHTIKSIWTKSLVCKKIVPQARIRIVRREQP